MENSGNSQELIEINTQEARRQTVTTPSGEHLNISLRRKIRKQKHMEEEQEIGGVIYEIPSEGGLNTSLWLELGTSSIPLAASTTQLIDHVPTVVMLQRVITDSASEPLSDSSIPHPYTHFLQGSNRIPWEELLLEEQERIAKESEYKEIRLRSAFEIPYTKYYYDLSIAAKQYDRVVNRLGWLPYTSDQQIQGDSKKTLDVILRKLRDKKLKTRSDIRTEYPDAKLPTYWSKQLS